MRPNVDVVKKLRGHNKVSQHPPLERAGSLPSESHAIENIEDIKLLQKDLILLEKKLYDVQNMQNRPESVVSFVSNLRSDIEAGRSSTKLHLTEKIVTGIIALDREILKKTAPTTNIRPRRNSRGGELDADLYLLPTHLTLVDRLIDFHALLQREQSTPVIITQKQDKGGPIDMTPPEDTVMALQSDKTLLEGEVQKLRDEVERLKIENAASKEALQLSISATAKESEQIADLRGRAERAEQMVLNLEKELHQCQVQHEEKDNRMEQLLAQEATVIEHINSHATTIDSIVSAHPMATAAGSAHSSALNGSMVSLLSCVI